MTLKLIKASKEYEKQIVEMLDEWLSAESDVTPWAIVREDYHDFDKYIKALDLSEPKDGYVPDSTFFCMDTETDKCVGAVNIRHYLSEALLDHGGHIGDGVRPSARGRGIATKMISFALDECRRLGIDRVLMTCDKDNVASAKTIIKNGGVLENEIVDDGRVVQRYWIDLK